MPGHSISSAAQSATLPPLLTVPEADDCSEDTEYIIDDGKVKIVDEQTDPWGIKVKNMEIKDVKLPSDMQRAIARQAEAERDRRAKIINADGELQAATKLGEAAAIIERNPSALQLRYLQTLNDISAENASTIVFPVPIELFNWLNPKKDD